MIALDQMWVLSHHWTLMVDVNKEHRNGTCSIMYGPSQLPLSTPCFLFIYFLRRVEADFFEWQNVLLFFFPPGLFAPHIPAFPHPSILLSPLRLEPLSPSLSCSLSLCCSRHATGVMDLRLPSSVAAGQGRSLLSPASALCLCQRAVSTRRSPQREGKWKREEEAWTRERAEGGFGGWTK